MHIATPLARTAVPMLFRLPVWSECVHLNISYFTCSFHSSFRCSFTIRDIFIGLPVFEFRFVLFYFLYIKIALLNKMKAFLRLKAFN